MTNENLQIDPAQLDEEWLQQPLLFDEAQEKAADCLEIRDNLKLELVELEADRGAYIREAWEKEGFKKAPTVAGIDDWVLQRPEVSVAKKELNEAQIKLVRANNTVESFQMRKRALEKLTDLHISNYFSVPNPNHLLDGGKRLIEVKNQKVEEASKKATETLNKKKKSKSGKTAEEVKEKIKDPGVKEAMQEALDVEIENNKPKQRRRRR